MKTKAHHTRKCAITIMDVSHAADGLYFGVYAEPVNGELIYNYRVDTRNYRFVMLEDVNACEGGAR